MKKEKETITVYVQLPIHPFAPPMIQTLSFDKDIANQHGVKNGQQITLEQAAKLISIEAERKILACDSMLRKNKEN